MTAIQGPDGLIGHLIQTAAAQTAYRRIIEHLAETVDFPHWHTENHPTPEEVEEWVTAGELYLAIAAPADHSATATRIAGVVVLNHDAPDAYMEAAWAIEAARGEVLVVQALGVVPEFLHKGIARFLVDASLRVAKEHGA